MAASASQISETKSGLPYSEVNWDRLDKRKFFLVGTGLFTGVTTLLYPFSVVKTRLQVASLNTHTQYNNTTYATVRSIAKYEGIAGFYRGFGTVVAGTIPGRCVYLSMLEMTKASVLRGTAGMGLSDATSAGLAAGMGGLCASLATQLVVVPVDVISSRLMAQGGHGDGPPRYAGGVDALRSIVRAEGVRGLYRGFGVSIMTYAPSSATWWSTYGASQRVLWKLAGYEGGQSGQAPPSLLTVMAVQAAGGTCAGGMAALVTTPLDTVKTRIQVLENEGGERPGVRNTVRRLMREEGLKGFYRGLGPRWASMALWGTCMVTTYEFLKRLAANDV